MTWQSGRSRAAPVGCAVVRPSLKSLHLDELTQHISAHGAPSYRAKQIADWLYKKRVASFADMTDLPATTRTQLAGDFSFTQPEVVRVLGSKDTTRKFLFRLADGNLIESVLIRLSGATARRRIAGRFAFPPRSAVLTVASFARAGSTVSRAISTRMRSSIRCWPSKPRAARRSTTSFSWAWVSRSQT
jgi:hypothetical protein